MRQLFLCTRLATLLSLIFVLTPIVSDAALSTDDNAVSTIRLELKSSTPTEVALGFQLDELRGQEVVAQDERFQRFEIEDESSIGPEGWPELPTINRMVLIPAQSGVELRIRHLSTHIEENVNVYPRQVPIESVENYAVNFDRNPENLVISDAAANYEGFWPPEVATIGRPAIMRGYRMVSVDIHPMRWNRQTRQLEVVDEIEIELDFSTDANRVNTIDLTRQKKLASHSVYNIVADLVVNPPEPPRDMGVRNGSILYVMKQWDDVENALQPLIEWRRQMGWTVGVLRVANNSSNQQVKAAIQQVYDEAESPPEMVIICGDTDRGYPMPFFDHRGQNAYPYESDHDYIELDGDDILPDAAIGRFCFDGIANGEARLNDIVEKIVSYESDPFIGEGNQQGWQKRAAFFAGDDRSGLSSIDVCKWSKELLIRNDYEEIFERYWGPGNPRPDGAGWIPQVFNTGISFFLYRGWTFMNGFRFDAVMNLRNDRMLPFVILPTCNTGDYSEHISSPFYYSERFLFAPGGGGIGCIGAGGATHTAYNNLFSAAVFRAVFGANNPYQGWATEAGKVELYNHYFDRGDIDHEENRGVEAWLTEFYIFNLIGDPATDLYTDVPMLISVEHPEDLRSGESHYEVTVLDDEDEPLANARVCFYQPEELQIVKYTDDEGRVSFDLNPQEIDGDYMLTVTGHNLMPYQAELEVTQAPVFLGAGEFIVDDDGEGESNGDGDEIANPTERIELTVEIINYGEEVPEGAVNITLTPGLPNLEVVAGEVELEAAPAAGESADVLFVVDIGGGFPDEQLAIFNLECTVGETSWISSVSLPLDGPELEFVSLAWEDEPIRPAELADLTITIRNIGSKETGDLSATLVSLTQTIDVPIAEGDYENIPAEEEGASLEPFRLAANLFHLGGSDADLALVLTSEAGFVDTAFFSYTVAEAGDGQPFGPDNYGYICLDNTDENWFSAPVYEWIEIDPHRRGEGTDTELSDTREEGDESTLVDLPFTFQYYGQDFNEITICTNGWLAMGDCSELITGRNRQFPAGMCAPGMIGPFWDDLLTTNDGGIYTFYDEEQNIFIVEWSQMRRLGPRGNNEASETFQVLLYDPEFYININGDGDIVFQYLDVTDDRSCFQTWDTPYASVGICSPDQGDGLTYTYWNELSDGAAPLEEGRAIKFTSSILATDGEISGTVIDVETEEPIEGATVYTLHGFVAITDENGFYEIHNAPTDIDFTMTATAQGYNDSTRIDFFLEEEGEIEINFALLHPEFELSLDELAAEALIGERIDLDFTLANNGNGQLAWHNEVRNPGDANAEPWELRNSVPASEISGDSKIQGAVFVDGLYYMSGSNGRDPQIYVINLDGELEHQYNQPGDLGGSYGFKDLAYDGELIWGTAGEIVYGFTLEGELIVEFEGPFNPNNNVAWDPDMEVLWVSSTTSDMVAVTREGEQVTSLDRNGLRVYGLAYWPFDPDGHNLYIFHKDNEIGDQIISKANTETGETVFVTTLEHEDGGTPIGAFITNTFDVFSWVWMAVSNDGATDRVDIWQIDARRDWAIVEPVEGILETGESEDFVLHLNASSMPEVLAEGELHFFHNAAVGHQVVPINFNIIDDGGGNEGRPVDLELLDGWNMISINVVPPLEMYENEDDAGPDIIRMTEQLRIDDDNHHVQIMKDQFGRFYNPAFGFNNIPYWSLTEGYQISVDEAVEMQFVGEPIPPDSDIPLRNGWNIVAYLPDYELDASSPDFYVLQSIRDNLEIAKDFAGRFMLRGDFDFSNMLPWTAGQGYMVKVNAADLILNYPPEQEDERVAVSGNMSNVLAPERTGENMSLLVTSFEGVRVSFGDVVIALDSDGAIVGRGTAQNGMCGLAIWGDDEITETVDGLVPGETFELYIEQEGGINIQLSPVSFQSSTILAYETDGLVALSVTSNGVIPDNYYMSEGYPNPFNSTIRLSFGMPEASDVNISVFDLSGRQLDVLTSGAVKAGQHTTAWNARSKPSGIYWIKMTSGSFQQVRKVMLVK
ncbi:MAG: T9SS type A sorting domain-containing protein [Calditrichaeota bacterium]|nr:T9SS type A sorting domain-containing protein [Calditrichota bacterium]MBT7618764.1 T9SS type A sorting domain-containing protein [Calditrichota bacterium]